MVNDFKPFGSVMTKIKHRKVDKSFEIYLALYQGISGNAILQKTIFGVEKKLLPHLLCVTNMLPHGIDVPSTIRRDNTLARPLRDYTYKDPFDRIIICQAIASSMTILTPDTHISSYPVRVEW